VTEHVFNEFLQSIKLKWVLVGVTTEQAVVGYEVYEFLMLTVQSVDESHLTYDTGLLVIDRSHLVEEVHTICVGYSWGLRMLLENET
jgi:hypothetical protein